MTPREKAEQIAAAIVERAWRTAPDRSEANIASILIRDFTSALTVPDGHVRGPDGVDRKVGHGSRRIDSAIRRAAKEAWNAALVKPNSMTPSQIEQKYGVKL